MLRQLLVHGRTEEGSLQSDAIVINLLFQHSLWKVVFIQLFKLQTLLFYGHDQDHFVQIFLR